jgi:two-component system LytT family sensor kinase
MDADRLADLRDAHRSGAHVGIGNINQRMRSVYGEEYALMVETAPGAGMKVILRVPKFSPNVRPAMPGYTDTDDVEDTDHGRHAAVDYLADSGVNQINVVR